MSGGYQLAEDVSLDGRNTFRVPARAAIMADVTRAAALAELFDFAMLREGPVLVLGEGSNLLFAGDFPGVVVCLTMAGTQVLEDDGEHALVRAEAGVNWNDFVRWTLGKGLAGLENLALIPGTVGACPIQNIGAYGVEVGEFIETVEAFHRGTSQLQAPGPRRLRLRLPRQRVQGQPGSTGRSPRSSSACRGSASCAWTTPACARNWRRWASRRRAPRTWPRRSAACARASCRTRR